MMKKILTGVVSLMLLVSVAFVSSAVSVDDAKKELQQTQKEINAINAKKKAAAKSLLNDKKIRESIIADLQKKGYAKSEIEAKIKDIEAAIQTIDAAILYAQEEYDAQLALFQERLIVLYVQSKTNADIDEILKSDNFDEMFKKVHMLQLISKFDQDLMIDLEKKQDQINELKSTKLQEEANAHQQLESSLKEINELQISRSVADDRVAKSQQSIVQLEKAENLLEKEANEFEQLIKRLSSAGKYSGSMQWPVPDHYKISSPFGYRIHPILKYRKFHGGIDIHAPSGAYIQAASAGTVIWSGWRSGGSGNTIIIDHGSGMSTLYLHIKTGGLLVKEGQKVKAGDVIAKVGSTGLSTGPHLHFEVRKNGERQDPTKYVSNKQ